MTIVEPLMQQPLFLRGLAVSEGAFGALGVVLALRSVEGVVLVRVGTDRTDGECVRRSGTAADACCHLRLWLRDCVARAFLPSISKEVS